jgi:hypothetical protein
MQHNLKERIEQGRALGLVLPGRTESHLLQAFEQREYLVTRYDPSEAGRGSELNRMERTLEIVADWATALLANAPAAA